MWSLWECWSSEELVAVLIVVEVSPPSEQECGDEVDAWNEAEENGGPEDEWLRDPVAQEWTHEPATEVAFATEELEELPGADEL